MDTKNIAAGSVTVLLSLIAGMGGGALTAKAPSEMTVKAGATTLDRAVSAVAQLSQTVRPMTATRKWAVVENAVVLSWWCGADAGDVPCPSEAVEELDKASADGISATLTPTIVGDEVRYAITVQPGAMPERPEYDAATLALLGVKDSGDVKLGIDGKAKIVK
jgi:hypothetical protein